MKLLTYLNYGGNCAQAFRFYEQHLGAKITMMMTHGEAPNATDVTPDWKNAILHARMSIGETDARAARKLDQYAARKVIHRGGVHSTRF